MRVHYTPLLHLQHDLYRLPRGMERFQEYLRIMIAANRKELKVAPLVAINPMAKDSVATLVAELLAQGADEVAAQTAAETAAALDHIPGEYQVSLVLLDDAGGGWTNRFATEYGHRFGLHGWLKDGWLYGCLWSSEPASRQTVREEMRALLFRTAYLYRHGAARTLRGKMAQEGCVMVQAEWERPTLDVDDLEYSRAVITPFLDADDMRTAIECLYGDLAGRTLGFTPRGLSDRAGLALALHDAQVQSFDKRP